MPDDSLPSEIEPVYKKVSEILESARNSAWRAINTAMLTAYWEVGKAIVEDEKKAMNVQSTASGFLQISLDACLKTLARGLTDGCGHFT